MNGTWQSRGYGWLLNIDDHHYSLSHLSRSNCVMAEEGPRAEFLRSFDRVDTSRAGILSLHQAGDLTRYEFRRLKEEPHVAMIQPGTVRDAAVNFETLWNTFDEHYAFFDLHRVDWQENRRQRARVTPNMPDEELLEIFSEMLLPLDDGHVSLATRKSGSDPNSGKLGSDPDFLLQTLKAQDLRSAFRRAFGLPNGRVSPRSSVDAISPRIGELLLAPFKSTRSELRQACNGIVSWCRLKSRIGYLSVLRLFGFADTEASRRADDLPHTRSEVARFLRDDMAALEAALDRVFADLADCEALILDLRINGGGFDRAGMAIANRLADRARLAFSKRARDGNGFTASQELHLEPTGAVGFQKPVYVMTSPLCVSAGEICVLSLRALPQVTIVGQHTAGMLSDNLNKVLPNGWAFSLSNEVYTSADSHVFEGSGVLPNLSMQVVDPVRFVEAMQSSLVATVKLAS